MGYNWDTVKEKFLNEFLPANYHEYMKISLNRRLQQLGESPINYISEKVALCKRYNDEMTEDDIMAYIKEGLLPDIHRQILLVKPSTIDEIKEFAKIIEHGKAITERPGLFSTKPIEVDNSFQKQLNDMKKMIENLSRTRSEDNQVRNYQQRRESYNRVENSNFYQRNDRRTDGGPTSWLCGKHGHVAATCYQNRNVQQRPNQVYQGNINRFTNQQKGDDNRLSILGNNQGYNQRQLQLRFN